MISFPAFRSLSLNSAARRSVMRRVAVASLGLLLLPGLTSFAQETGLGRHKQLYAVPAPGPVEVDGKFNDWDLSGQIEMFVLAGGKDTQGAKFAIMYDKEAIYLSGVVRDTTPMMNRHDPAVTGFKGWDADSIQFRMVVDSSKPYPETAGIWELKDDPNLVDSRDDLKHLTLWYYTDREEPVLAVQSGFRYRAVEPSTEPFGVLPSGLYQAKYVKDADGLGYTFEYRIPWTSLGAKAPLKGGDTVAGTVQFNFGAADGLKTGGGSAWAYDVMSGPGFVFQSASVWGKVIFSEVGNVAKELVEAGVPKEKPNALKFTYELPKEGQVTLQLFDKENMVRRTLVAQGDRPTGKNVEAWDGMDDQGKPLPTGAYKLKGIIHDPITSEYLFSLHNSGNPPYPTEDGTGAWGADHGPPNSAVCLADGDLILGWSGAEYGYGVIRVSPDGRKKWGTKTSVQRLATDGKRFFAEQELHGKGQVNEIRVFDAAEGRSLNFGNGTPVLTPPPAPDKPDNTPTGLAYADGEIFVSYGKRNLVAVYDATSGDLKSTLQVPEAGALAGLREGGALAISAGKLVSLRNGEITPVTSENLDEPAGMTVDADGLIYVSNQGERQDVTVYDASGKFLRSIGKAGGRPAKGQYENNGMFYPRGLAVDKQKRLWVAEDKDRPKRISVWDTVTGAFEKEFFGGSSYFSYATIDPARPNEIFSHDVIWSVDWEKKSATPQTTVWRKTAPNMVGGPNTSAYPQAFRMFTTKDGQQYGWGMDNYNSVMYRRDGDLFKPFLSTLHVPKPETPVAETSELGPEDPARAKEGNYLWQDANDDQTIQLSEMAPWPKPTHRIVIRDIASDLTIWTALGEKLKLTKIQKNGQAVYDLAALEDTFLTGTPFATLHGYLWLDPDGSIYTLAHGHRPSFAKWSAGGKMEWGYPGLATWNNSLGMPPSKPGRLWGMTGPLGVTDDVTASMTYFGVVHLFRRDGLYAAAVFKDGRSGISGPELGQPEGQGGSIAKVVTTPGGKPRTFVMAAGGDARIMEVHGLETIESLPDREFTLGEDDVRLAADAFEKFRAESGSEARLAMRHGKEGLASTQLASYALDGAREVKANASYDDKNLYVRFEVISPSDLVNAITDPSIVFKGGNCLDIQLATDPAAEPGRKTPAPGDIRLLVTRQLLPDGKTLKPYAVLFEPKVKGFDGAPTILTSPTGEESFDRIRVVEEVKLEYKKTPVGLEAVVSVPLSLIGWNPKPGEKVRMELGYLFGNATGNQVAARAYLKNRSFTANVVNDVPHESRLEPAEWAEIEIQ